MSERRVPESKVRIVEVLGDYATQRLDNFLIRELKGVPKSRIYQAIRRGEVRVNGGRCRSERRLNAGDKVRIPPIRVAQRAPVQASPRTLDQIRQSIIYEDKDKLILNKPAGMAVHGGSGVSLGVIESLRLARPDERSLELVHRLDRGTSGCLMIAKRRPALRFLQAALREKTHLEKHYLALVHGQWSSSRTRLNLPLERFGGDGERRLSRVSDAGKASLTRFELQQAGEHYSLIQARPVTGRTHQIRVHCAYVNCPVAGDDRYADRDQLRLDKSQGVTRLMLHASSLVLPAFGDQPGMRIEAPLDEEFNSIVKTIFNKNK
jgi:23S rRNA pseudouridine955/2504/2580 synthase